MCGHREDFRRETLLAGLHYGQTQLSTTSSYLPNMLGGLCLFSHLIPAPEKLRNIAWLRFSKV